MFKEKEEYRVSAAPSVKSEGHLSVAASRMIEDNMALSPYGTFRGQKTLERGLKSRHVQLIALGGGIGTGLFVGTGSALGTCGPAAVFISYIIMSFTIWQVMNMMAEMVTFLPVPGNTAQNFVTSYFDESLGFAIGYNYWYAFSILVAAEVTAAAIVVQYWTTKINVAAWISIFLVVIFVLNMSSVKYFGEAEFWFASLKLIAIVGLIIVGVVIFFGGAPTHDRLGFRYWKHGLAFSEHLTGGSTGRFLAVWTAIIKSGFSFICTPELVTAAGGECVAPRRNIPKAANRMIYRLATFYILGSLVLGVICSSTSKRLMSASDASASPFVIGIQNAGIKVLNHIINAVILTSAASAGNSFLYSASRALYTMALKKKAPRIFATVNRFGVPYYCVLISWAVGCLAYLNVSSGSSQVFNWFSNITTISGFISWIAVAFAYLRWRKAIVYHGLSSRVSYRTVLQPFGAYFVIVFIGLLTITNGYAVFFDFKIADFLAAYITFPIVLVLYLGHMLYVYIRDGRFTFVRPLHEIDLASNLDAVEEEDALFGERVPRNFLERVWFWIA